MSSNVTAVAGAYYHTCAVKDGALYCWGRNDFGQLGDGTRTNRNAPTAVRNMGSGVSAVAANEFHTCAIKSGELYCWGNNSYGELGDGTDENRSRPVVVKSMDSGVSAIAIGLHHSLALKADGCLYAWGSNNSGQLGNGDTDDQEEPVQVTGGCDEWGVAVLPPGSFGKSAPANKATNQPASVTLRWSAPLTGTVHSYRYCYATTSGCVPTSTLQVLSPTTSVTVTGLMTGTTYYWQVRACADSACSAFADADNGMHWSFTVSSAAQRP